MPQQRKGWLETAMTCVVCSHDWHAVYPIEATEIECPNCNYMNPLDVIEKDKKDDDDIWR